MSPDKRFTAEEKKAMADAIRLAEDCTSGEIRIHIENRCAKEVLDRASAVFAELKMHKTALRNGVLIYVALDDHKLAIIGDAGINAKVAEGFWSNITLDTARQFSEGEVTEGICEAVRRVGGQLKKLFPHQKDDVNELSNDVSFGGKE